MENPGISSVQLTSGTLDIQHAILTGNPDDAVLYGNLAIQLFKEPGNRLYFVGCISRRGRPYTQKVPSQQINRAGSPGMA